jgi:hypothetical protein
MASLVPDRAREGKPSRDEWDVAYLRAGGRPTYLVCHYAGAGKPLAVLVPDGAKSCFAERPTGGAGCR